MARPSRENFAENLSALLEKLKLNKTQFAKKIAKSDVTVGRWLRGEQEPSFEDKDAIIQAAKHYGVIVTVADLYADPTEPQESVVAAERRAKEQLYRKLGEELGVHKK